MEKINRQNPSFEQIEPSFGSSFALRKFDKENSNKIPIWHFHPEIEIVFIKEGSGKRHIGNHISQYYQGDLIMVGPNLPHSGFTDRFSSNKSEIIVQMRADFLGYDFFKKTELTSIQKLIDKSTSGLSFYGNTKTDVGERLESMFYMSQFEKLVELLKILNIMASSREFEMLNATGVVLVTDNQKTDRLNEVFKYVRNNYQNEISLHELAAVTNMTVPSFCRFFKQNSNKTFIEFLNEYRITNACRLLAESSLSITDVCFDSGFNNFSHFNKTFKKVTGKSPSDYRKEISSMVLKG